MDRVVGIRSTFPLGKNHPPRPYTSDLTSGSDPGLTQGEVSAACVALAGHARRTLVVVATLRVGVVVRRGPPVQWAREGQW